MAAILDQLEGLTVEDLDVATIMLDDGRLVSTVWDLAGGFFETIVWSAADENGIADDVHCERLPGDRVDGRPAAQAMHDRIVEACRAGRLS